ncbi:MAG: cytochrome c biogenesis protein CcsA, partial [Muribaculaceae bacterium]|nr:cytochrome c biogenesis protein CcsA [Muribaculaceae bacterium]
TPVVPVLRSPLLSLHVLSVMLAYTGLAIIALCSAAYLCGRRHLLVFSRKLLLPTVFLLTAGIFIGAVWADRSWGRYWGWDPKEVWALITLLIYSFPLHTSLLPCLRCKRAFAIYTFVAFITVLITYFGVNFFMRGLHSYA